MKKKMNQKKKNSESHEISKIMRTKILNGTQNKTAEAWQLLMRKSFSQYFARIRSSNEIKIRTMMKYD